MSRLKFYIKALLDGLIALIVLLAIVNLAPTAQWQLLLNYFLLSNYLLLYPANKIAASNQKLARSQTEDEQSLHRYTNNSDLRRSQRSGRRAEENRPVYEKEQSTMMVTNLCVWFAKNCGLLVIAPALFFKNLVFD